MHLRSRGRLGAGSALSRRTRGPIITGESVTHGRPGKQPTTMSKRRTCPMCGTSCPLEAVCIVCFEPMESRRRFQEEEALAA